MKIVPQRSGKIIILTRDLTAQQEIPCLLGWTKQAGELRRIGVRLAIFPLSSGGYAMNKLTSATATADEPRPPPLSPAGHRVLGLLEKRCAYQVHGAWRFRGLHSCVKELTFLSLLANGLAERVETDRHQQIRITPAGRSVCREIPRQLSVRHLETHLQGNRWTPTNWRLSCSTAGALAGRLDRRGPWAPGLATAVARRPPRRAPNAPNPEAI